MAVSTTASPAMGTVHQAIKNAVGQESSFYWVDRDSSFIRRKIVVIAAAFRMPVREIRPSEVVPARADRQDRPPVSS